MGSVARRCNAVSVIRDRDVEGGSALAGRFCCKSGRAGSIAIRLIASMEPRIRWWRFSIIRKNRPGRSFQAGTECVRRCAVGRGGKPGKAATRRQRRYRLRRRRWGVARTTSHGIFPEVLFVGGWPGIRSGPTSNSGLGTSATAMLQQGNNAAIRKRFKLSCAAHLWKSTF